MLKSVLQAADEAELGDVKILLHTRGRCLFLIFLVTFFAVVRWHIGHAKLDEFLQNIELVLAELESVTLSSLANFDLEVGIGARLHVTAEPE